MTGSQANRVGRHKRPRPPEPLTEPRPQLRRRGIEEHLVVGRSERAVEIGAPAVHAVLPRQLLHLGGAAPDQQRIGHEARAVLQQHAALLADLEDRADQVLVHPHPPGHAVHDDADSPVHSIASRMPRR